MSGPLQLDYDRERDIVVIEGVRYAGDFFRQLADGLPVGMPFVIVSRKDGVLAVQELLSRH